MFFAIAQIFGAFGPLFYGVADRRRRRPAPGSFIGYSSERAIMIFGGIVEIVLGINAEGKSLEDITKPITSTQADPAPEGGPVPAPAG